MIAFPVLAIIAIAIFGIMAGALITAMVASGAKEDAYRAGMKRGRRDAQAQHYDDGPRRFIAEQIADVFELEPWQRSLLADIECGTDEDDDLERRTP